MNSILNFVPAKCMFNTNFQFNKFDKFEPRSTQPYQKIPTSQGPRYFEILRFSLHFSLVYMSFDCLSGKVPGSEQYAFDIDRDRSSQPRCLQGSKICSTR